jgi:hypothetical protein
LVTKKSTPTYSAAPSVDIHSHSDTARCHANKCPCPDHDGVRACVLHNHIQDVLTTTTNVLTGKYDRCEWMSELCAFGERTEVHIVGGVDCTRHTIDAVRARHTASQCAVVFDIVDSARSTHSPDQRCQLILSLT